MKKPLEFASLKRSGAVSGFPVPTSIKDLWITLVPQYESRNYGPTIFNVIWDRSYARRIEQISQKRSSSRIANYLIPSEIERVRQKLNSKNEASIRFGNLKTGHGYDGERGDFCLIAGVIRGRNLTVYYRSLELIGGFAFDLTLLWHLERELLRNWATVTFVTQKAFIFALKGNSNEKLYPKLKKIFQQG